MASQALAEFIGSASEARASWAEGSLCSEESILALDDDIVDPDVDECFEFNFPDDGVSYPLPSDTLVIETTAI